MTDLNQKILADRIAQARGLSERLHLAAGAWGAVLSSLLDRVDGPFAVKDAETGRYVHANARMERLVGQGVEGLGDEDWLPAAQAAVLRAADQSAMVQTVPQVSEHRLDCQGQRREFSVTRLPLPAAEGGAPRYLACVWMDLTAQRHAEAQLQVALAQIEQQQQTLDALRREAHDASLHDPSTGLYRSVHFDDQLRREVDLSMREHREFALVSVALDPLNAEARALGEPALQRVHESLGQLLRSNTRAMDSSSRRSGDLFAVLLSGVGLATAHSRMEGLRRQCATQLVMLNGQSLGFTVSMGVASFPHTAQSQGELLSAADIALTEAQRRGGNHVALASIRFEGQ